MTNSSAVAVGVIGTGRLGSALAQAIDAAGYRVGAIYSQGYTSAHMLASNLRSETIVCANPQEVADIAGIVFVTTPDDIVSVIGDSLSWQPGHTVIHCSGALSANVLASVQKSGAKCGGFHPMQTFSAKAKNRLQGITIAIEGDHTTLILLKKLAADLGSDWVIIPSDKKPLYHLSTVLISNYIVALLKTATDIWASLGISEPEARKALMPLITETTLNLERVGSTASLTGPISRGDLDTIQTHLNSLAERPALLRAYRALGSLTIPVAIDAETIGSETASRLHTMLGQSEEVYSGRHPAAQEVS